MRLLVSRNRSSLLHETIRAFRFRSKLGRRLSCALVTSWHARALSIRQGLPPMLVLTMPLRVVLIRPDVEKKPIGLPPVYSLSIWIVCVMCGARSGEAQRAEAAARHQGRSTPGGGQIGGPQHQGFNLYFFMIPGVDLFFSQYWGFIYIFLNTGILSPFSLNTGGLSDFLCNTGSLSLFFLNTGVYLIFLLFSQYRGFIKD